MSGVGIVFAGLFSHMNHYNYIFGVLSPSIFLYFSFNCWRISHIE